MGFDDILILAKLGPGYDEWGDTVDGGLDVHGVVVGVVCGDGVVLLFLLRVLRKRRRRTEMWRPLVVDAQVQLLHQTREVPKSWKSESAS